MYNKRAVALSLEKQVSSIGPNIYIAYPGIPQFTVFLPFSAIVRLHHGLYRKKLGLPLLPPVLPSLEKPSSGTESWLKMGSLLFAPSDTEQESEPLRLLAELPQPPSWSEREVSDRLLEPMETPLQGGLCLGHPSGRLGGSWEGDGSVGVSSPMEHPESGEGRN